jgi:hypothetical protein
MRLNKELDKVVIFMEILNLLLLNTGIFPTMDVPEFATYDLEFDINNSYQPLDEEIKEMLALENKFIDEKKNVCINDHVVAEIVSCKMFLM